MFVQVVKVGVGIMLVEVVDRGICIPLVEAEIVVEVDVVFTFVQIGCPVSRGNTRNSTQKRNRDGSNDGRLHIEKAKSTHQCSQYWGQGD